MEDGRWKMGDGGKIRIKIKIKEIRNAQFERRKWIHRLCISAVKECFYRRGAEAQRSRRGGPPGRRALPSKNVT